MLLAPSDYRALPLRQDDVSSIPQECWSNVRRVLSQRTLTAVNKRAGNDAPTFAEIYNQVGQLLAEAWRLYEDGKNSLALDTGLHPLVDLIESEDTLVLSAYIRNVAVRVSVVASTLSGELPREIDLWIGTLTLTRGLRDRIPVRHDLVRLVKETVSAHSALAESARLLRNID